MSNLSKFGVTGLIICLICLGMFPLLCGCADAGR